MDQEEVNGHCRTDEGEKDGESDCERRELARDPGSCAQLADDADVLQGGCDGDDDAHDEEGDSGDGRAPGGFVDDRGGRVRDLGGLELAEEEAEAGDGESEAHEGKAGADPGEEGSLGGEVDAGVLLDGVGHGGNYRGGDFMYK